MAKKRYRADSGYSDSALKFLLQDLTSSLSPYHDEALNAIESGDKKEFEALLNDPNLGGRFSNSPVAYNTMLKQFDSIQSRLPDKKSAIKKYLDSVKDESNLSESQIQDKIQAYQDLQPLSKGGVTSQIPKLAQEIYTRFDSEWGRAKNRGDKEGGYETALKFASNDAARQMINEKSFNIQRFVELLYNMGGISGGKNSHVDAAKGVVGGINNAYLGRVQNGEYADIASPDADFSSDIERLTGLQSNIQERTRRRGALDDVLGGIPSELKAETDRLIGGEIDRGARTLEEELTPEIMQGLNVRGLLHGGDLEAELTRGAEDIFGGIENTYQDLLAQDDEFYRDASFRATLQKVSEDEGDYLSGLERERTSALNENQNRFKISQANLQTKFENDIFRRQQQRALNSYEAKAKKQRGMQESQSRGQLLSNILTPISQIATAKIAYGGGKSSGGGVTTGSGK